GVVRKEDSILYSVRWNHLFSSINSDNPIHLNLIFYDKNHRSGSKKRIFHREDSICYSNDELRFYSKKKENVHFSNINFSEPFEISFNYFEGKTSSIYWIKYGNEIEGEMIVDSARYTLTGLKTHTSILLTAYNNFSQAVGVVTLSRMDTKPSLLTFKKNCTISVEEKIEKVDFSKMKLKFGEVYLPSIPGGSANN
ncbi:MAG: hypothetical protein COA38_01985, partial [Fluviicola sp.]